jgi:hypothetical protein
MARRGSYIATHQCVSSVSEDEGVAYRFLVTMISPAMNIPDVLNPSVRYNNPPTNTNSKYSFLAFYLERNGTYPYSL